ncbi:MAG: hypothetical protein ACXWX0_10545 [Actinomycetota bacterium]
MPGVTRSIAAVLACLAMLVVACNDDEPVPPASPTSAFPSGTGTASGPTGTSASGSTGTTASGSTGALPSPDPGGGSGHLTRGTVGLQIAGDVELETSLPRLITGVVTTAPGAFAVVWAGAGADATTVGIGGGSFVGTQTSSPTLVLAITAQTADGLFTWVSTAGECEVRLEEADTDRVQGTFACHGLSTGSGEVVDVSASFQATG